MDRGGQGQYRGQQQGGNKVDGELKKTSPLPETDRRKSSENSGQSPGQRRDSERQEDQPQPQRGAGGRKSREQQVADLKDFTKNFNLAGGSQQDPGSTATSPQPTSITPAASTTPLASPGQIISTETTPPSSAVPLISPTTPVSSSSSPTQQSPPDLATKSTLNPNAKEFSLNPTAKEFTPRGAGPRVGATPPRPQTPSTPSHQQMTASYTSGFITLAPQPQVGPLPHVNVNSQMFVPQHINMNSMGHQVVTSQYLQHQTGPRVPTARAGPPQQPPGKDGGSGAGARPDLPSPIAVTGHPILAGPHVTQPPQPGPPFFTPHQQVYLPAPQQLVRVPMGLQGGMVPGMIMSTGDTMTGGQHAPATNTHANMWGATPPSGVPPPIAAATPPAPQQSNTPAPSPGLGQMYGGTPHHPPQPNSLPPNYPGQAAPTMLMIPGGGFPGHIPTSGAQHGVPAHNIMGGPVTSGMPQYMMAPHQPFIHQQGGQQHLAQHIMAQQPPHNQQ